MSNLTSYLCKGLSTYHPEIQLLTSLGRRFIAKFLIALLAADGHFLTLLLSTLWSLRGSFTTLCLQGIFGSGKTYCASMMLVVATSILGIPTLLTAEPNLPLYTAADTICDLLREASESTRRQYARLLAQNIPVSTSIDYDQKDRANLFQENSPLRWSTLPCLLPSLHLYQKGSLGLQRRVSTARQGRIHRHRSQSAM